VHDMPDFERIFGSQSCEDRLIMSVVRSNIEAILRGVQRTGGTLMAVSFSGNAPWCVVVTSEKVTASVLEIWERIDSMQAKIDPKSLDGTCFEVHRFAVANNVGSGVVRNYGSKEGVDSVYRGLHEIGYCDAPEIGSTVYFDLSSKAYLFSDIRNPSRSIASGLVVIDELHQTANLQALYGGDWKRPDVSVSTDSLERDEKFFLKD